MLRTSIAVLMLCCTWSMIESKAFAKSLILHDMGGNTYLDPVWVSNNKAYLDTLPVDGLAIYMARPYAIDNISAYILQPKSISTDLISSVIRPIANMQSSTLKKNFALVYFGAGFDVYDDAKWAIVAQNMANLGQALKAAGLTGIFVDNENYSDHGDWRPGSPACDANRYSLVACQAKTRERGAQVMRALQSTFPEIAVLFFHDAYTSDATFYARTPNTNDVTHANELLGPFIVGCAEAKNASAFVIQGNEDPGVHSFADRDYYYQYSRYGIALDMGVPTDSASRAAGGNGFIPSTFRPVWGSKVTGGQGVRNFDNVDGSGNPTTLKDTITNAMNASDEYTWLYMDVPGSAQHTTLTEPPGSSTRAATQAFVDAVRAGRSATAPAQVKISNVNSSSVTSSSATITWTTDVSSDSVVEYGITTAYGSSSTGPGSTSAHLVTITNLSPLTTYQFRVKSTSAAGAVGASGNFTFSTPGLGGPPPAGTTFVSDLQPTLTLNGWGPVERDRSNGEQAAGDGRVMRLNGVAFSKGLGAHAPSDIRYYLGGGCSSFQASIGVDDEARPHGTIAFQVYGDAVKLYDSGTLTGATPTRGINVATGGYKDLRLVITDAGDNVNYDHGDWADAKITCSNASAPTISSTTPGAGATNVTRRTTVTATFSGALQTDSITASTFFLVKQGTTSAVAANVTYDASANRATLTPQSPLEGSSTYTATIKGGPAGVRSTAGVPLAADRVWSFTTTAQLPPPPGTSFVSDAVAIASTNGWGPAEMNRSNGEKGASDGRTITLNGATFPKGIGVHAGSELKYFLGGSCTAFAARVGVDDEVGSNGSVVFQVWADGAKLYDSGRLTGNSRTVSVNVPVTGKSQLSLVVTDAGDGINFDHADWAEATITCQ